MNIRLNDMLAIVFGFLLFGCTPVDETESLRIDFQPETLQFSVEAASDSVTIVTNGNFWELSGNPSWCSVSRKVSTEKTDRIRISVSTNTGSSARTALLVFSVNNGALLDTLVVTQGVRTWAYPDYSDSIPGILTGMTSTSKILAAKMYAGWNLGNSLEVPGDETGWGNAKATQLLIDSIQAAGFNTVRLPCAWNSHLKDAYTCQIDPAWLARVKEVVNYCINDGMYVILNIHWDGGWLENNPTYAKQVEVNAKQKAYWEQIATAMKDFDEHLLFAGTNEVNSDWSTPSTENIAVQHSFNQTFVTAVRSTGGRNLYRNLVVQAYSTNIGYAKSYLKMPTDVSTDRMFVEVHYYDPWDFCGETGSGAKYYWGTPYSTLGVSSYGQESYVDERFALMKTNFVNKGYPVILGEYGVTRRGLSGTALTNHLASRAYYYEYVTRVAKNNGLVPCYWDNGALGTNGCGIFDRSTGVAVDRQALQGLKNGAKSGVYPY